MHFKSKHFLKAVSETS